MKRTITILAAALLLTACSAPAESETPPAEPAPATTSAAPVDYDAMYRECVEEIAISAADMSGNTVEEEMQKPEIIDICEGRVEGEKAFEEMGTA